MPGTKGNVNAMTHGVCSYLSLGKLPKGCAYIRRQVSAFRRELEAAVAEQCDGEINIRDAAFVNSAARHEGRCQSLTRYLRGDDCKSLADRLAVLREIGHATDRMSARSADVTASARPIAPKTANSGRPSRATTSRRWTSPRQPRAGRWCAGASGRTPRHN